MAKEILNVDLQAPVNRRGFSHSLAVYGLIALSLVYSGAETVGRELSGGRGVISPQGEGWIVRLNRDNSGLRLRIIFRADGVRPAPCQEEEPLQYTRIIQTQYTFGYDRENGYYENRLRDTVEGNPANICEMPQWGF